MNTLNFILAIASSSVVGFFLGFFTIKHEIKKIKALANQEVSKSDQEKITTADKTIDLVDKLRLRMDKEFESMSLKLEKVENELELYKKQCSFCSNNKIGKTNKR